MSKQDSIPYVTPWFVARYPKISSPDTEGKFADGKFKTDGYLEDADYEQVEKDLTAIAAKFWPGKSDVSLPLKKFFKGKDADKKQDGRGLVLKSKFRAPVFDGKKKKLPEGVKIGGGSVIRVAAFAFPWSKAEKVKVKNADGTTTIEESTNYGVGLRLGDIQLRKLVEHSQSGDGSAFDDDEGGFEYDGEGDTDTKSFDSATDL